MEAIPRSNKRYHHTVEYRKEESASCSTVSDSLRPMDCSLLDSSAYGISQARTLEWVATSFSRGSSQPKDCRLSHQGSPESESENILSENNPQVQHNAHPHNRILLSHKKEPGPASRCKVDESRKHEAEGNRPDTSGHTVLDSTYVKCPEQAQFVETERTLVFAYSLVRAGQGRAGVGGREAVGDR